MEISQSLEELDWIPRPKILALRRLGITTAEDLLTHFPRRHEDRHQFPEFPRDESDIPICLSGEVIKTNISPAFRRLEKDFRSDVTGTKCERIEPAAHLSLVQFALRPENDRHRPTTRRFRQATIARDAYLHGSS